ncbi:MAG: glycosyltransferase family 4 protein [Fulvivirga sp.]
MRILIIHQYYKTPKTGGAIRSYHIAKHLAAQGHEVEVITAYNDSGYFKEVLDNVTIHHLPIYYSNHLTFWSRIKAFVKYVWLSCRFLKSIEKPDLNYVISTPLTTGIIALYAKWRYKVPYIFEVGDLWPAAPIQLGVIKNVFLKKLAYWLEKRVYNNAKSIIGLSPDITKYIAQKTSTPTTVVTNFSDSAFFTPSDTKSITEKFGIGYFGTVGLANRLEYLLEAAAACINNNQIEFIVMGGGAQYDRIVDEAGRRSLSNIIFKKSADKEDVKIEMAKVDAVYVSFANADVLSTGSPNKFFDGLAAGKLIILNFGGWLKDEVEEAQCGFSYDPERPTEFLEKLNPFIEDQEKLFQAQKNAVQLADKFSLGSQLSALDKVIKKAGS